MADVFVSYAHANLKRVTTISDNLQQAGFSVWWDSHLRAGDDFAMTIEREIQEAKCVVVAWSGAARDSLWVRAEATAALDAHKLCQTRLDDVKPPLPFTVVEMIDLTNWRGERGESRWQNVESAVRSFGAGKVTAPNAAAFVGPALQDMGSTAALGWLSISLIVFVSALTLSLGPGGIDPQLYAQLTKISFGLACIAFFFTLLRLVRTAMASATRA